MPVSKNALIRYQVIDQCLSAKYDRYCSIEKLQQACMDKLDKNISISMMQKDITAMKDSRLYDAPIKYSRSKNGYYYEDPEFSINKVPLGEHELEALEFAAGIIEKYKHTGIGGSFSMTVDKVINWIKGQKYQRDKRAGNIIFPEKSINFKGTEKIDLFVHCILEKIPVSFIHYSYQEHRFKACVVHPYFLKEQHSRWYLVGHSEMHKCIRIFGLDRIEDVVMLEKRFVETPGLNGDELFKNSIGIFINMEKEIPEIIIDFSRDVAGYIKTQPIHESQEIMEYMGNGGVVVKLKVYPDEEFFQMILSYGANAVVMSPDAIRQEVEQRHGAAKTDSIRKTTIRKRQDEIRNKLKGKGYRS